MEKEKVLIRKIKDGIVAEQEDVVAVEYHMEIVLDSGEKVEVTCTPTYLEEMILSRRFLAGERNHEILFGEPLKEVDLSEIFAVAKETFENPGALFSDTGCAHSCALIYQGKVVCHIEDVGRHNALDKVIGYALKNKIPFSSSYIFASGRIAGDYLEKALAAGFPMVVSRAAVTNQAVHLAREKGITLLGFIRKNTGNIYHEGKVKLHG